MDVESKSDLFERSLRIFSILTPLYPDTKPILVFRSPFELLVATVLSAQCTDAMVNRVTPTLFARFPSPETMADASTDELEAIIHSTGFFRAKAKNLKSLGKILTESHGAAIPDSMEDLTALPGVGRKTAGVILSVCYGRPAIIVDTHFGRVAKRLGFTSAESPEKIEKDVASFLPEARWNDASHLLNRHGRVVCLARAPLCASCAIATNCPFSAQRKK